MADAIKIKIDGIDECMKIFDKMPDNMVKMEKKAMRKASQAVTRSLRKSIPKRFRRLIKYKMHEDRDKNTYVLIGLYNRKEVSGHQSRTGDPVFDWFKAYWANYGTLNRRDPNHQFLYKIKPKTKGNPRRQDVGQPAQNFFKRATNGWQDIYFEALEKEMKKEESTLYER